MLASAGWQLLGHTLKSKIWFVESSDPSFARAVMLAVPLQPVAGVNVSVVPEILMLTFESDEVAE